MSLYIDQKLIVDCILVENILTLTAAVVHSSIVRRLDAKHKPKHMGKN